MFEFDTSWLEIDPWLITVIVIIIIAFIALAINRGIRAHRLQVSAGREDLIGKTAEVKTALEPKGVVSVQGERWTAISEKGNILPNEEVIITKVNGLILYVTKKE
ncbi:MAG: NfeD family protein [Dehalococcoidales bacterium]|nr:NfeD family protein [Dehalococcoidales bacterium]